MLHNIGPREYAHLKFTVSGRSKQANKHTHTRAQCSHASVGLTQACPNQTCNLIGYVAPVASTQKTTKQCQTLPPLCVILKVIHAGVGWIWFVRLEQAKKGAVLVLP